MWVLDFGGYAMEFLGEGNYACVETNKWLLLTSLSRKVIKSSSRILVIISSS